MTDRQWAITGIVALAANIVLPWFLSDIVIIRYVLVLGMVYVMIRYR